MVSAGWSPRVRLFEAAAIGTPTISDAWPGLDAFFAPAKEILIADSPQRVTEISGRPSGGGARGHRGGRAAPRAALPHPRAAGD